MINLEHLFCSVNDFYRHFENQWHSRLVSDGLMHRQMSLEP